MQSASKEGIEQANGGDGVVLLADLGSGILSSQMAIDLLEEDIPVQIADAPILEAPSVRQYRQQSVVT